jgi:uncharacterized protein
MNKYAFVLMFLTLNLAVVSAQTDKTASTERTIDVTGTAEMLIAPNEFTFKITLRERFENKEKITIEKQEEELKKELTVIGVDIQKELTIADMSSIYTSQKRKKDVIGSKDYQLKINDLSKIEKLQQIADKLDVGRLDLEEATHSDLAKFRKETKMAAVRAAKSKAEYMLEAIGDKLGKTIHVQEVMDYGEYQTYNSRMQSGSLTSNVSLNMQDDLKTGETLSFSKIKLKYNVAVTFEIK